MSTAIHDILVIGGGPAGLAAAIAAKEAGAKDVLILERERELGGILNQCIHNGFGLHTFQEELTGPEYAARYISRARQMGLPCRLGTTVVGLARQDGLLVATAVSRQAGLSVIRAKALVLAMGCRERPRGALNIPGTRPAGIFSAGTAQRLVNLEGWLPGKRVVILGSGDIGLIMARRMALEGAQVLCVAELMPYSGGLKRNIVQCLQDYGIPLKLSHTVVDIRGRQRLEGVTIAQVDGNRQPIPGTEEDLACDTLLLSVGLLPENELSKGLGVALSPVTGGPTVNSRLETNISGVFACGNVLHVHDLVDYVSEEAAQAGRSAAAYVLGGTPAPGREIPLIPGGAVRYTVPATLSPAAMPPELLVRFRVGRNLRGAQVTVRVDGRTCLRRQRPVMAPGEMEQVVLKKSWFTGEEETVTITAEETAAGKGEG
ncbi:NAD(P)/FAD-dependent oxidoreductase [Acutalibacter caecimuris]|uniref:NAD(P)/FAD-dependent oxidoreductase n=1 Tax=Acutalibacter caecimuris TaxID=3093657 RepID=UPI002AC8CDB5|nr:FAD-dependent oxidoreductase [Acutalibacter sp. M00118]